MKTTYKILINKITVIVFLTALGISSCKKLVEADPPVTSITGESVFKDDVSATAVLTGIYTALSQPGYNSTSGLTNLSKRGGLSSDELSLWSGAGLNDQEYYTNALAAPNGSISGVVAAGHEIWSNTCYSLIFRCNQAIEELTKSTTLTPFKKQQLLGEAKFMRAFFYFYLVNLYGDIPLAIITDYKINSLLPRTPKTQVYNQIISDLRDAQTLLSATYLNGQLINYPGVAERVRPTSWTATALLARVYLYMSDWANAEIQASTVINNSTLFSLSSMDNAFLRAGLGNNEAIWQLQPVNTNGSNFYNTEDARLFILTAAPVGVNSTHIVYLSPSILAAFETGDNRKTNWVGTYTDGTGTYYFPNKYKIATAGSSSSISEYPMVLRLAEQYLVRAEARAQQNNIGGAQSDLNTIRSRAGLGMTTANDKASLLTAILHERQVELFTEWGHRWLDLKRTNNIDAIMNVVCSQKGGIWNSNKQWYPLPISDLLTNPNLVQNQGY